MDYKQLSIPDAYEAYSNGEISRKEAEQQLYKGVFPVIIALNLNTLDRETRLHTSLEIARKLSEE